MLDPRADVARLCETDDRWTEENLYEFVALADDFYRDTDFHAFFEDHAGLYAAGEELVNSFAEVDTSWFMAYYGRPFKAPELYLSFVNGPSNYAMTDSGIAPGFGVLMGMWMDPDRVTAGNITANIKSGFMQVVIHELFTILPIRCRSDMPGGLPLHRGGYISRAMSCMPCERWLTASRAA